MNKLPRKKRENPLPNGIDHSTELRVKQQDKGNGLPQSIAGYDPHLLQTMLIQCVSQELGGKKKKKKRERAKNREKRQINIFLSHQKFLLEKAASSSAPLEHILKKNASILVFRTWTTTATSNKME